MLMPFEETYSSVCRVTLGGEKSSQHLYNQICKIFPNAKVNNIYASTEAGSLFVSRDDCFQIPNVLYEKIQVDNISKEKYEIIYVTGKDYYEEFNKNYSFCIIICTLIILKLCAITSYVSF